jgi:putative membrane protein (TIGR04086 family)
MQGERGKKPINFNEIKEIPPMINTLKGVAVGYAITIIVWIAYAILLTYTDLTEKYIPIVVTGTEIIAVLVAGYDSAKGNTTKGWLWGMAAGLIYAIIMIILGTITMRGNAPINLSTVVMLIMLVAGGGLGGMIGVNRSKGSKARIVKKTR